MAKFRIYILSIVCFFRPEIFHFLMKDFWLVPFLTTSFLLLLTNQKRVKFLLRKLTVKSLVWCRKSLKFVRENDIDNVGKEVVELIRRNLNNKILLIAISASFLGYIPMFLLSPFSHSIFLLTCMILVFMSIAFSKNVLKIVLVSPFVFYAVICIFFLDPNNRLKFIESQNIEFSNLTYFLDINTASPIEVFSFFSIAFFAFMSITLIPTIISSFFLKFCLKAMINLLLEFLDFSKGADRSVD